MSHTHREQQTGHESHMEPGDLQAYNVTPGAAYEASYGSERDIPDPKIIGAAAQLAYCLSGAKGRRLRLSVRNTKTGRHFTYQVETARGPVAAGEGRRRFVSVLTGPDNQGSYTFLGTIFDRGQEVAWHYQRSGFAATTKGCTSTRWHYYHGKKSTISNAALSARGWLWLWPRLAAGVELPSHAEIWHEGTCGRCGRALTDPESIAAGIGPVCRGKS